MKIKTKITIICFMLVILGHSEILCQVVQDWVAIFNGQMDSTDIASRIVCDSQGDIYVTGSSKGISSNYDICTIKYNASGVQQWVRRFNGQANLEDQTYSIDIDSYNNVYVAGFTSISSNNIDYCIIKYSPNGVQQWVRTYNGPGNYNDVAYSIACDPVGNVVVTGYSSGSGTDDDICTIKYNTSGTQQWIQRYNGTNNLTDIGRCVNMDVIGNIYITGHTSITNSNHDFCTIKYNSNGVQQWVKTHNGPNNGVDQADALTLDKFSNVYVIGSCTMSTFNSDFCLIKYNTNGLQQWIKYYNGPGNGSDFPHAIALDDSNNIYVTGEVSSVVPYLDMGTIKYNNNGVQQWAVIYDSSSDDRGVDLVVDRMNNVYVTGVNYLNGFYDYCTVKYNTNGVRQWLMKYNGASNNSDLSKSICVDSVLNIYITGNSYHVGTGADYCTIKYSQIIGIQKISDESPTSFFLRQNFPNPFNPVTLIKYDISLKAYVMLKIYDVLGREVKVLVSEIKNAGTYEVEFDGSNLSSGLYFYRLESDKYTETKKMVLIK